VQMTRVLESEIGQFQISVSPCAVPGRWWKKPGVNPGASGSRDPSPRSSRSLPQVRFACLLPADVNPDHTVRPDPSKPFPGSLLRFFEQ
jgi:hypothetical protein